MEMQARKANGLAKLPRKPRIVKSRKGRLKTRSIKRNHGPVHVPTVFIDEGQSVGVAGFTTVHKIMSEQFFDEKTSIPNLFCSIPLMIESWVEILPQCRSHLYTLCILKPLKNPEPDKLAVSLNGEKNQWAHPKPARINVQWVLAKRTSKKPLEMPIELTISG